MSEKHTFTKDQSQSIKLAFSICRTLVSLSVFLRDFKSCKCQLTIELLRGMCFIIGQKLLFAFKIIHKNCSDIKKNLKYFVDIYIYC